MPTPTYNAPLIEVLGESAVTLSTSVPGLVSARRIINNTYADLNREFKAVKLYCASDWKFLTTPRIKVVWYYDTSATTYYNYTQKVINCDVSDHLPLDGMVHGTTGDYLYVGCVDTFLGLYFVVDSSNKNANTATLDVEYYNGSDWTDVTGDSDGTDSSGASSGATLEQSGNYVWTLPTTWARVAVNGSEKLYYIRFKPSATLSAAVDIEGMVAINKGTSYGWVPGGQTESFTYQSDLVGGLQYLSVSGTPSLYITWIRYWG